MGQLLSASSHPDGATPYGMIVSAGSASAVADSSCIDGSAPVAAAKDLQKIVLQQQTHMNPPSPEFAEMYRRGRGLGDTNGTAGTTQNTSTPKTLSEFALPDFDGYCDLTPVYSANHIHVYRARSLITGKPVMLKVCPFNHLDTLDRFRHEWKMLADPPMPSSVGSSSLQHSNATTPSEYAVPLTMATVTGLMAPSSFEYMPDGSFALVYIDEPPHMTVQEAFLPIGNRTVGTSTPRARSTPPVKPRTQSDLIRILSVFSAVVSVLEVAHSSGVTHNNINTFSILVTRAPNSVGIEGKLGGWHLASRLERQELGRNVNMVRGENPAPFQYIAPECSGRMNRSVDFRADFYSLGVSLYELVVGFLPFRSSDPLGMYKRAIFFNIEGVD